MRRKKTARRPSQPLISRAMENATAFGTLGVHTPGKIVAEAHRDDNVTNNLTDGKVVFDVRCLRHR